MPIQAEPTDSSCSSMGKNPEWSAASERATWGRIVVDTGTCVATRSQRTSRDLTRGGALRARGRRRSAARTTPPRRRCRAEYRRTCTPSDLRTGAMYTSGRPCSLAMRFTNQNAKSLRLAPITSGKCCCRSSRDSQMWRISRVITGVSALGVAGWLK